MGLCCGFVRGRCGCGIFGLDGFVRLFVFRSCFLCVGWIMGIYKLLILFWLVL